MAATAMRPWEDVLALGLPPNEARLAHRTVVPARAARTAPLPDDLDPRLVAALERRGVRRLWSHQAAACGSSPAPAGTSAWSPAPPAASRWPTGCPSSSGCSRTRTRGRSTSRRRRRSPRTRRAGCASSGGHALRPALYDGDTSPARARRSRRRANLLLTNPDMLTSASAPPRRAGATFLRDLALVIVDESHVYRGVFGAHVAHVLRRLRRACSPTGNDQLLLAVERNIGNPVEHVQRLTGLDEVAVVGDAGAPRAAREFLLWNPELDPETDERDSALSEAVRSLRSWSSGTSAMIGFARCRASRRTDPPHLQRPARDHGPRPADRVDRPTAPATRPSSDASPSARWRTGDLLGVVATSALELGIDIGVLDASVVVTFPGTVTSLRQRWGRAARSSEQRGPACWSAATTRSTSTSCATPRSCWSGRSRRRSSACTTRGGALPHLAAPPSRRRSVVRSTTACGADGLRRGRAELVRRACCPDARRPGLGPAARARLARSRCAPRPAQVVAIVDTQTGPDARHRRGLPRAAPRVHAGRGLPAPRRAVPRRATSTSTRASPRSSRPAATAYTRRRAGPRRSRCSGARPRASSARASGSGSGACSR